MHLLYRSKRRSHWLLPIAATIILLLSACSGQLANTNWSGMSTDGSKVYLAFGPRVLAYDTETESQSWIFPAEGDSVQFFSAPSAAEGQVVFGDYGQAGGFLSPRVTVSIYSVENVDTGTPPQLWTNSESATDKIVAPPLQVGDQVFIGTADNVIMALDAADGTQNWSFETGHAVWGRPAYRDGILYVSSMDWSVYALDAETGELVWNTQLGGALASGPLLGDELLYVSSFDGNVHALEISSGEARWAAPANDWVWGTPALAENVIYYSDIAGNIFAADATTGEQIWTLATDSAIQSSPVVMGDVLYIAAQATADIPTGTLTAYSTLDGSQVWQQTTPVPLYATPVVVGDDTIVAGLQNADSLLIGYDLATGQELWRYSLPG